MSGFYSPTRAQGLSSCQRWFLGLYTVFILRVFFVAFLVLNIPPRFTAGHFGEFSIGLISLSIVSLAVSLWTAVEFHRGRKHHVGFFTIFWLLWGGVAWWATSSWINAYNLVPADACALDGASCSLIFAKRTESIVIPAWLCFSALTGFLVGGQPETGEPSESILPIHNDKRKYLNIMALQLFLDTFTNVLPQRIGVGRLATTIYATLGSLLGGRRADSGCGRPSPWSFDSTHHSNQTIGDRSFYVHIPASYNPTVAHAVVLSFHGSGSYDVKQETVSAFSQSGLKINGKGIIAVYPMGAYGPGKDGDSHNRAWQGAPYAKPGVDDIAFTQDIINNVKANLCVDEKRIYASGKSNGGGFVNLLACTPSISSHIAAFALVSPALYPDTHPLQGCEPGRPVPIIDFHGLADHVIPYRGRSADKKGRTEYALPAIPVYRKAWALRNGCSPSHNAAISHPHRETTVNEWDCSPTNSRAVVKGYTIRGLGHSWPNTKGLDHAGKASFDATPDDIVPFFDAHSLG